MDIIYKTLAELTPYDKNAKKHDDTQINNVAESIKQFVFVQPIVVDKDNVIVIGHCRALAAERLGMEEVPCVSVDDLTEDQIQKLRIVDNKSNESPWDFDLLYEDIEGLDFDGFDFDFGLSEPSETEERSVEYIESISVVIECEDDEQAEELFDRLTQEGYKCRISTL